MDFRANMMGFGTTQFLFLGGLSVMHVTGWKCIYFPKLAAGEHFFLPIHQVMSLVLLNDHSLEMEKDVASAQGHISLSFLLYS